LLNPLSKAAKAPNLMFKPDATGRASLAKAVLQLSIIVDKRYFLIS